MTKDRRYPLFRRTREVFLLPFFSRQFVGQSAKLASKKFRAFGALTSFRPPWNAKRCNAAPRHRPIFLSHRRAFCKVAKSRVSTLFASQGLYRVGHGRLHRLISHGE